MQTRLPILILSVRLAEREAAIIRVLVLISASAIQPASPMLRIHVVPTLIASFWLRRN